MKFAIFVIATLLAIICTVTAADIRLVRAKVYFEDEIPKKIWDASSGDKYHWWRKYDIHNRITTVLADSGAFVTGKEFGSGLEKLKIIGQDGQNDGQNYGGLFGVPVNREYAYIYYYILDTSMDLLVDGDGIIREDVLNAWKSMFVQYEKKENLPALNDDDLYKFRIGNVEYKFTETTEDCLQRADPTAGCAVAPYSNCRSNSQCNSNIMTCTSGTCQFINAASYNNNITMIMMVVMSVIVGFVALF